MRLFNKVNFSIGKLQGERHLEGMRITSDFTEVTNGHYLVRVGTTAEIKNDDLPAVNEQLPLAEKIDIVISAESAERIKKSLPKVKGFVFNESAWPVKNNGNIGFAMSDLATGQIFQFQKQDVKWPDSERIIKKDYKEQAKVGFKVDYMINLCRILQEADICFANLTIHKADEPRNPEPMKIEGENKEKDQKITIMLMPAQI